VTSAFTVWSEAALVRTVSLQHDVAGTAGRGDLPAHADRTAEAAARGGDLAVFGRWGRPRPMTTASPVGSPLATPYPKTPADAGAAAAATSKTGKVLPWRPRPAPRPSTPTVCWLHPYGTPLLNRTGGTSHEPFSEGRDCCLSPRSGHTHRFCCYRPGWQPGHAVPLAWAKSMRPDAAAHPGSRQGVAANLWVCPERGDRQQSRPSEKGS